MSETSEKTRQTILSFIQTDRMHRCLLDRYASTLGVYRGQHHMLLAIYKSGKLNQKELAEKLQITPAAVTSMIKKLEASGYVERKARCDDNRANDIAISEKGMLLLDKTKQGFSQIDEAMLSGFDDAELQSLMGYLERMRNNMEAIEKGNIPLFCKRKGECTE